MPTYHGKVKCVYIDPPYNTGNEGWAYNDRVNSPMMQEWFGKVVDRDDLTRHDKWCCMMLPRLKLLRDLLSDEGAIFVSIDDNEVHRLRFLMDDVFGEENFIGSFVWEGTGKNDARFISVGHDYVLCYARSMEFLRANRNRWRVFKEGADEIKSRAADFVKKRDGDYVQASEDLRKWFRSLAKNHKAWPHRHYNRIDANGVYFAGDISWPGGGGPTYEVNDQVHFGSDESLVPNLKRYLDETEHQVLTSVFYRDRRAAHKRLRQILPDSTSRYPKDERALQRLLEAVTTDDDIVLDSFAGSGSTAHAVLALNKQDGGNRRFVLVECEDYVDTLTAERVRRVAKGVPGAKSKDLATGLGGTFSYFKVGLPMRRKSMFKPSQLPGYDQLAGYVFFTATGEEFEPEEVDQKRWFIGESTQWDVYLIYDPNVDVLKDLALTLGIAESFPDNGRERLVFAPTKYMDLELLHQHSIKFAQLPFEIYETVDRVAS